MEDSEKFPRALQFCHEVRQLVEPDSRVTFDVDVREISGEVSAALVMWDASWSRNRRSPTSAPLQHGWNVLRLDQPAWRRSLATVNILLAPGASCTLSSFQVTVHTARGALALSYRHRGEMCLVADDDPEWFELHPDRLELASGPWPPPPQGILGASAGLILEGRKLLEREANAWDLIDDRFSVRSLAISEKPSELDGSEWEMLVA